MNPCYYCGEIATDDEHVVPQTVRDREADIETRVTRIIRLIVPSCHECNLLVGAKVFDTLEKRKDYIQERLRYRYKSLAKMPIWTEPELQKLGPDLQAYVRNSIIRQRVIKRRLAW